VNVTTGAVSLLAQTAMAFSATTLSIPLTTCSLVRSRLPQKLIAATNSKWSQIENDSVAMAEGQNKGAYKSTKSSTWDTIQLTAGQMIQLVTSMTP